MFLSLRATGWQDRLFYRKTAPTKPNFASYHTHDSVATPRHTARLVIDCSGFSSGRGSAWLERLVRDQEVGGSNPLAPIFKAPSYQLIAAAVIMAAVSASNAVWGILWGVPCSAATRSIAALTVSSSGWT